MNTLLLDLAILYRALAWGADAELAPAEVAAMRDALGGWAPGADPALVDHVIREAALANADALAVRTAIGRIGDRLDAAARAQVLSDLRRIATADEQVTRGEANFLGLVEEVLGA